jgi:hypothetical protein
MSIDQPTRRRPRLLLVTLGVAAAALAIACGNGGTPGDGATTTTTTGGPTTTETTGGSGHTIISFQQVGPACDGNNEVTLSWELGGGATGATIAIDGPGIYNSYNGTTATEKFPGACDASNTQTFLLTTTGPGTAATETIVVTYSPPATTAPPTVPTIVEFKVIGPKCDSTNQITLTWTLAGPGVTGATISIDGPGVYNSYSGLTVTEKFPGACGAGNTQTFLLKTVGGSPVAQKTIVVNP